MEHLGEEEITDGEKIEAWNNREPLEANISKWFSDNFYKLEDWGKDPWGAIIYKESFIQPSEFSNQKNKNLSEIKKYLIEQGKNPNYGWTYSHTHNVIRAFHWKNDLEITFDKDKKERVRCIQATITNLPKPSPQPLAKLDSALEHDFNIETKQYWEVVQSKEVCQGIQWKPITKKEYDELKKELNNS